MTLAEEVKRWLEQVEDSTDVCTSLMHDGGLDEGTECPFELKSVGHYGGEDQGIDYWTVWKFSKGGEFCYIKFWGRYASHYGTDYEGFCAVVPAEVTVTQWKDA